MEIAKLSLWLRTAQPRRKLNDLSSNIKCGNSLIDSKAVAGDKAFKWEDEFPKIFVDKEKKAYHITTATHDSRTSQRMIDHKVRLKRDNGTRPKAEGIWLDPDDGVLITTIVADIVKEDNLNVMAFNICGDHLHMLLVCEEEEVSKIVGKIKGKTSRVYNYNKGINPLVQSKREKSVSLWTQKFGKTPILNENQLWNTVKYIRNNREKHNLPELPVSKETNPHDLIEKMYCTYEHAFRKETKGGFDVVIGNPPYVNANELKKSLTKSQYKYLKSSYITAKGTVDLYIYFFEKGINLIQKGGILSYITPNRFLSASYGKALRELLISKCEITSLIDYSDKVVFPDASTYPVISFLKHKTINDYTIITGKLCPESKQIIERHFPSHKLNILEDSILGFLLNDKLELTEKVISQAESLKHIGQINATSTAKEADDYSSIISENKKGYKLINTGTIDPYCNMWGKEELTDSGKKY